MPRPPLEAQLTSLTQEFVGKLVEAIRNASFAEVAALSIPRSGSPAAASSSAAAAPASPGSARAKRAVRQVMATHADNPRVRQTAAHRAELGDRVVQALKGARAPLGVRALSSELGVPPDLLAAPLRELRAAGRITKHGEKRATTYSAG
jgi:hypothetical protein